MEVKTKVALLDNTIQLDRLKAGARKRQIDELLEGFYCVGTSISLLEFKATYLQECITIHNALRKNGRYTVVRDALVESQHRQHRLRAHIFNNMLNIFAPSSLEIDKEQDFQLAEEARLQLENVIPRLYKWFASEGVHSVLSGSICCTRATEPPRKKNAAFEANLPICRKSNKKCRVEHFIRERAIHLADIIRELGHDSEQLEATCQLFEKVASDPNADISHSDCRRAGDCLIALEAEGQATHAFSTNTSEWALLCGILDYDFVRVSYPEEKKR